MLARVLMLLAATQTGESVWSECASGYDWSAEDCWCNPHPYEGLKFLRRFQYRFPLMRHMLVALLREEQDHETHTRTVSR